MEHVCREVLFDFLFALYNTQMDIQLTCDSFHVCIHKRRPCGIPQMYSPILPPRHLSHWGVSTAAPTFSRSRFPHQCYSSHCYFYRKQLIQWWRRNCYYCFEYCFEHPRNWHANVIVAVLPVDLPDTLSQIDLEIFRACMKFEKNTGGWQHRKKMCQKYHNRTTNESIKFRVNVQHCFVVKDRLNSAIFRITMGNFGSLYGFLSLFTFFTTAVCLLLVYFWVEFTYKSLTLRTWNDSKSNTDVYLVTNFNLNVRWRVLTST